MSLRRSQLKAVTLLAALPLALSACSDDASEGGTAGGNGSEYPSEDIEFITAGDPGGGLDLFARQIQKCVEEGDLLETSMTVTNLGDGGGNLAMAEGRERAGDAHTLIGNSNRVYINPVMGTTDLAVGEDFVPVAQLMTEYMVIAVPADSPYEDVSGLMAALSENPGSVNIGIGSVGSDDQLSILRAADIEGIDPASLNLVAFSSGGDLMTQLLGGRIDAASTTLSEALPQYEAGQVRLLAISSPERLEDVVPEVPTWTEQGIDLVHDHWRGVFGPADMPQEAVDYWSDTLEQVSTSECWADVLETNGWSALYRDAEEFAAVLEEEASITQDLLSQIGLAN